MSRFAFCSASARILVLALLIALRATSAVAVDTGKRGPSPTKGIVDCTQHDNQVCLECGAGSDGVPCCVEDSCDVVIGPPPPPPPAPSTFSPAIRYGLGSMRYFTR